MSFTKTNFASGFIIAFVLNGCGDLHAENASLCKMSESPLFSCSLSNSKIVSICASASGKEDYVEYKYGTDSKLELSHKAHASNQKNKFHRAEIIYASSSEDTIWFRKGQFTYSIFMPARGTPGIEVTRNKDVIARHECAGGWRGATRSTHIESNFIEDHGTGDSTKFESLW